MGVEASSPKYKPKDQYKAGDIVLSAEQIAQGIEKLAAQLAVEYRGKNLLIVGIMKGAMPMMSDLARALHRQGLDDQEWSTITLSRYKNGTTAQGEPLVLSDTDLSPEGRHVLLIDEVLDGGDSLRVGKSLIEPKKPASIKTAVMVEKEGTNVTGIVPDYIVFPNVPAVWMEGYGMDTSQKGRGNPDIVKGKERSKSS